MKQAVKGALLSGLVFPGLGQLALKRYPRGFAFMAVALACTIHIVKTAVDEVVRSLPTLDPAAMAALPAPSGGDAGPALWVLGLCWAWGVLDAFLIGDKLDRHE